MSSTELNYFKHPGRSRLYWVLVYIAIFSSLVGFVFFIASKVRTHTLPSGQVQLSVPYSRYVVGESINFTLTNSYNSPIFITNKCPAEPLGVYRKEGDTWVRIHDQASVSDCTTESRQVKVPANGSTTGNFDAWKNLFSQTGTYRVVAFVEFYNALPYQEFQIIDAPVNQQSSSQNTVPSSTTTPTTNTTTPTTNSTTRSRRSEVGDDNN